MRHCLLKPPNKICAQLVILGLCLSDIARNTHSGDSSYQTGRDLDLLAGENTVGGRCLYAETG